MSKKSRVPIVEVSDDGVYSVNIAPDTVVTWRLDRREAGMDYWRVALHTPADAPVYEVSDGFSIIRPTRN
jgi:hypothetical protein